MEEYKEKAKEIMVIGHKNPDTDSICSAICYADLKNKITEQIIMCLSGRDILMRKLILY